MVTHYPYHNAERTCTRGEVREEWTVLQLCMEDILAYINFQLIVVNR